MKHTPGRWCVVPLWLCVAAAGFVVGTADQAPSEPSKVPQVPPIRVEASFVRVDAYPTADGRPVTDLTAQDFEVLEDGKPQKIDTFEHVVVRASVPQEMRAEPNSIEASRQLAANPRNRVFVVFLDAGQVTVESTWRVREPLIRLIDKILGPDDLVGIMMPRMAAKDVVLARKTQVVASGLRDIWPWGVRDTLLRDEREQLYDMCYPPLGPGEASEGRGEAPVVKEMMARRRERMTLEALHDLVEHLRYVREERKAILTVTEGWLLYRPDERVMRLRTDPTTGATERPPLPPPPYVDPWGRLRIRESDPYVDKSTCDQDRQTLAHIDDYQYVLDLIGDANRANATFYTIDPAGLRVFDTSIADPAPLTVDRAMLKSRLDSARMLAENTDGLAVQDTNNLDRGVRRISDDLSSYYLLGYYSTNTKLDGKFRNLTVRVRRPGVSVRARQGYRAATAEEVRSARAAATVPLSAPAAGAKAAIAGLSRIRFDSRLLVNAVAVPGTSETTVWVAGELPSPAGPRPSAADAATADIEVAGNGASGSARVTLPPAQRSFLTPVTLRGSITGPIDVRVRVAVADRTVAPIVDGVRLETANGALLFRRGPATGNRVVPAADARFSRTERLHVEVPAPAEAKPTAGRLLGSEGQPLSVPVTLGERADERTGQRWITADLTLAPLAPGDYAVEIGIAGGAAEQKTVTAIRVVK